MLDADEATCVSDQQLDPDVIEPVDTMIEDMQAGAEEGKSVKVPEAEQQQQPATGTDDLQQAVEVLKEKQEQKNLYTGLIIGLITGVGILCLLVSIVDKYQSPSVTTMAITVTLFSGGYLGVATV